MSDEQSSALEHVKDHRFVFMIVGSAMVALLLVAAALSLYISSGAYQLDLSRPSDISLRSQVQEDDKYKGFSSEGELNQAAIDEFWKLYDEKLKNAGTSAPFNEDVLSLQTLGIDQKSAARSEK